MMDMHNSVAAFLSSSACPPRNQTDKQCYRLHYITLHYERILPYAKVLKMSRVPVKLTYGVSGLSTFSRLAAHAALCNKLTITMMMMIMKKPSERRKHCMLAVVRRSQKYSLPPQTPFPGRRVQHKNNGPRTSLVVLVTPHSRWTSREHLPSYTTR